VIITAASPSTKPGLPPWKSTLMEAAALLAAVPRGQLDIHVLITLHRLLVPATNPYRGCIRDQAAVIWRNGLVVQTLPNTEDALAMAAGALQALEAAITVGVAEAKPVITGTEIVFRLLQAHPFMDGNGRVARAVGNWVLHAGGYSVVADPQSYCRKRKADYYESIALRQGVPSRRSDPVPWNIFFAELVGDCYRAGPR